MDFIVVRNCVMQAIVGHAQFSAVKIASYGMSISAYAVLLLTYL